MDGVKGRRGMRYGGPNMCKGVGQSFVEGGLLSVMA